MQEVQHYYFQLFYTLDIRIEITLGRKPYNKKFSKIMYANFKVFRDFRPLAHDINTQVFLMFPNISRNQIRTFLFHHCRVVKYHSGVLKRGYRKNLDFSRAEKLTEEDREYHKERLRKINMRKLK